MPIPEERLPEADESYVEEPNTVDSLKENDELEFETSAADESDDDDLDNEGSEADTAGFGFGEPAE